MNIYLTSCLLGLMLLASPVWAKDPMSVMLPVVTPEMSPGKVVPKTAKTSTTTPLFIVGDDALSHRWLKQRASYLASIHAIGMVVNVKTPSGLARMKQYGLTVYPVPGHDFANAFGLRHYPVLIEGQQIKQ